MSYIQVVIVNDRGERVEPDELTDDGRRQAAYLARRLADQLDECEEVIEECEYTR